MLLEIAEQMRRGGWGGAGGGAFGVEQRCEGAMVTSRGPASQAAGDLCREPKARVDVGAGHGAGGDRCSDPSRLPGVHVQSENLYS